jgi:tetratricopeptide (TPR) repeat protein
MPRQLTQYRVFIGSPGGLQPERTAFRDALTQFNRIYGEPEGIIFAPIGWEDSLGGVGRPQEQINEDLRSCDYAVFIFHDRWGSSTGSGKSSGTEEEWELALELYEKKIIRKICLFFREVDASKQSDPGPQLSKVLNFRNGIEAERKHLFHKYGEVDEYRSLLERHLAQWHRDNKEGAAKAPGKLQHADAGGGSAPSFDFWISEANRLLDARTGSAHGVLYCAGMAQELAQNGLEWAVAENARGVALADLGDLTASIGSFEKITSRFSNPVGTDESVWLARALYNKGITLGQLGRSEEEIAIYSDMLNRFEAAREGPLTEWVARVLFNKGFVLDQLGRRKEAIAVFDDLVNRFGTANEAILREHVAKALVAKGVALNQLNLRQQGIVAFGEVVKRFGMASELAVQVEVARALLTQGVALKLLDRSEEAISVYEDVVSRFGAASETRLRAKVATALLNKGAALGQLGRAEEEIEAYDDVVNQFGASDDAELRETVAKTLNNKSAALDARGRREEAILASDDVVGRFGVESEAGLREQLAIALRNKAILLANQGPSEEEIAAYDDFISRLAPRRNHSCGSRLRVHSSARPLASACWVGSRNRSRPMTR